MKFFPESGLGLAIRPQGVSERRFALKHATDQAHARLEGIVQAGDMFGSAAGYRRYLVATWAMRDRFERLLDASGATDIWPHWPERRIAKLAALDMMDLDLPAPASCISSLPRLTPAELLAVLYVMEGSSLGARILVRMVGALGFSVDFGARHLFAHSDSHAAWRSFLGVLEAAPEPPNHDTANAVFDAFSDAYQQARG